jgi:serine/threonine protein kinase
MELAFDQSMRYRLIDESKIETGNSTIYKAQDLSLNRTVCIKKIDFGNVQNVEAEYNRALLEIKSIVSISEQTTHVPLIYHSYFSRREHSLYIIMQWINGKTLEQLFPNTPPLIFLKYMEKLCDILEKLEAQRMSHKDIKPTNIMITPENDVFLIDFNLTISTPNQTEGTLYYKAPEMDANSRSVSRSQVDIFSVGVIMYQFFTGKLPARGTDYAIQSRRRSNSTEWDLFIDPITINSKITPCINELIKKCMKYDPKDRFRNARDLKRAITNAERGLRNGK